MALPKAVLIFAGVALLAVLSYFLIQGTSLIGNQNIENQNFIMSDLILKSSAFKEGETIPRKFTCDGENVNPLLEIRNIPENTKSLVLIMDDPDATGGRTWDHWLLFSIDPRTQYIYEDSVPVGARQGTTSFGSAKYGGPCPPRGNPPHRYMFKLYALDAMLDLAEGSARTDLEKAMTGHILDQIVLTGRYSRN